MITIQKRARQDDAFSQRKFFKKTAKGKVLKGELLSLPPSPSPSFPSSELTSILRHI